MAVFKGTWELRNNDSEIYVEMYGGLFSFNFHIQEINSDKLQLRQYNDPSSSSPEEERFYFVR